MRSKLALIEGHDSTLFSLSTRSWACSVMSFCVSDTLPYHDLTRSL